MLQDHRSLATPKKQLAAMTVHGVGIAIDYMTPDRAYQKGLLATFRFAVLLYELESVSAC